jgi:hypothetical protein
MAQNIWQLPRKQCCRHVCHTKTLHQDLTQLKLELYTQKTSWQYIKKGTHSL